MVADYEWKVTYDEARQMVLEALAPMGEEYVAKVKEGFETGWVDVYENKGKRTGAFSWGAYGTHPYVFLNFSGTLDDVFTIIHEMGHAKNRNRIFFIRKGLLFRFLELERIGVHFANQQGLSFLILGLHLVDGLLQFLSAVREINKASTVRQPFLVFQIIFQLITVL